MSEATKDLLVTVFKVCFSLFAGGGFIVFAVWGLAIMIDFVRGIWNEYRWWSLIIMVPVLSAGISAIAILGFVVVGLIYQAWAI